jgi:spectinomycin phosphotransferase/16S rRNA (guanine(1405)-N(7))-methyltransferase
VDVTGVEYVAVGFGSHHWRAATASGDWFVTVDDLAAKRRDRLVAALATVRVLSEAGFVFVVGPVPASDGSIVVELTERYVIAVYPLIAGRTHSYGDYTETAHRDEVVRHLAALHGAPASCRRWAQTETFEIHRRDEFDLARAELHQPWDSGPFAEPARRLLAQHIEAVERAFEKYDGLAADVSARSSRFVLTHGEPHPANTISTDHGVVLVDWDTALIAPPERDLWDLAGQDPDVVTQYERLTGVAVELDAVELYRLAWDLGEIAIYVSDFHRPHEASQDMSQAWINFQHYMDPNRW